MPESSNDAGPARPDGHAVVLGGSIAGLLAARVLADRFRTVTVVERDRFAGAEQRRGVPQGRHLHGLMAGGRLIMEELFPGLTAELVDRGAPTAEVLVGSRWYLSGLRVYPTATDLLTVLASRPLLEATIRDRVEGLPGVRMLPQTAVTGLVVLDGRLRGVRVAGAGAAHTETVIDADLVVDAMGRGTRAPEWLAEHGYRTPTEERVDVDLGYVSRLYRRSPEHLDGDRAVIVSTMPGFRGGGAVTVEGDRWHVTLAGMLGDHPPTDPLEFERFAATLPVPDVHAIVSNAEALGDPVPHRFRGSLRRHYESLPSPPAGFVAVGDSVASFNPLYAQGMTLAAQPALALRDWLREDDLDPGRLHRRIGRLVDLAWQMSTGADLRYPGVQGRRTLRTRLVNAYVQRVQVAAHTDPTVARTFMRLANLTEPPTSLLSPGVVTRVLRSGRAARQTS